MRKQKMNEAMLTMVSNVTGRILYKSRNPIREAQAAIQTTTLTLVIHAIYKNLQAKHQAAQAWIVKIADTYYNEQIMLADEIIKENSRLYPYNFLGLPQTLVLSPNSYQRRSTQTSSPVVNKQMPSLSSICRVRLLDKHRCELVISGNTEELRVNIYDEVNNLILSEQITRQGNFSRIYDLKWAKAATICLEVISKNGIFRTGQL